MLGFKILAFLAFLAFFGEGGVALAAAPNLTDEEHHLSKTYVDELGSQELAKRECAKLGDPQACQGKQAKTRFLGADAELIRGVAKAYATILPAIGLAGGGDFTRAPQEGDAEGAPGEGGKEKVKDWCQYIAAGVEALAKFKQKVAQENLANLPENAATRQKASLYKAARSHRERATNHKMQAVGWGATAACYASYMGFAGVTGDWKVYAKLGAAGFLAAFFANQAKAHGEYADKIRQIADGLPGPGDCNPVTQTDCFCSKPLNEQSGQDRPYYQKYCQRQVHRRKLASSSYHVPCVDLGLKADAKCTCFKEETCFDKKYFTDIKLPHLAPFANSREGAEAQALMQGELKGGRLAGSAGNAGKRAIGMLKKKLREHPIPSGHGVAISPGLEGEVRAVTSTGVPRPLASLMVGRGGKGALPPWAKEGVAADAESGTRPPSGKGQVWRFQEAKGLNRQAAAKKGFDPRSLLKGFKGKKASAGARGGNEVLSFGASAQASAAAQVHRKEAKGLFDIISYRYKVSAWRRLRPTP